MMHPSYSELMDIIDAEAELEENEVDSCANAVLGMSP